MALHKRENDRMHGLHDNRILQNQPTTNEASLSVGEESLGDTDEPPDEKQNTPRPTPLHLPPLQTSSFGKTRTMQLERRQSLLTQALVSSPNESHDDEEIRHCTNPSRATSTASTWSNASLTSDGGITSPDTRSSSPSPPLPPSSFHVMAPIFKKPFGTQPLAIRHDNHTEHISPLQKPVPDESIVEASLGRKRCISFACGNKQNAVKPATPEPKPAQNQAAEPPKRQCTIKFACGNQEVKKPSPPPSVSKPEEPPRRQCSIKFAACLPKPSETSQSAKSRPLRAASPAPPPWKVAASPKIPRSHRDSDSTVRNESPKSVRKSSALLPRKFSNNLELGRTEATRFHEFASSEEEVDEWTEESTVHRSCLTVNDTLKVENGLRQLGEEVEEEVLEENEEDEDEDEDENDEDDDEEAIHSYYDDVSSEGFQTDDEEGFAGSDDDNDSGSEYDWWAPGGGRSTAATSTDYMDHIIRPRSRRSVSESSIGSPASSSGFTRVHDILKRKTRSKRRPLKIRERSPELPDSTDFVCGTLDEDRPLEEAYMSCLERRRAAKHKAKPQDIDPTFPESDPEMDEEDDEDEADELVEESDQHMFMHGQLDNIDEDRERGRKRRSPHLSPRRLRSPPPPCKRSVLHRSPPPMKRVTTHRSPPPPGRLFDQSPKRLGSPPTNVRLRSPPPTRRTSFQGVAANQGVALPLPALARRPPPAVAASLPRTPIVAGSDSDSSSDHDTANELHSRGAIDIKAGLEKKRQRRREKMYLKHCRKAGKDKDRPRPGRGAERMREMGLELAAYRGHGAGRMQQQDVHMLSY